MRLKNFDKYIKDKLQGYKPAYQEDLWKAIEQKLPPSRVPNGQGSWLIVASAALVILALVPFLLKFNKLADQHQELAQIKYETKIADKQMQYSAQQNQISASINNDNPNNNDNSKQQTANQTASLGTSIVLNHNSTFNINSNSSFTKSSNKASTWHSAFEMRTHNNSISEDQTYHDNKANQTLAKTDEQDNTAMSHIALLQSMIDNSYDQDIKTCRGNDETGRYAERNNNLKSARWANWQSIFYPFWQNPAYTGSEGTLNVTLDAKIDAVTNVTNGNVTNTHTNFAADGRLPILGGLGIGIFHNSDPTMYSLLATTGVALSKAIISKGNTSVKLGVSFTSITNNYFYNSLSFSDQIVSGIGFVNATKEKDLSSSTQAFGINGGVWVSNPHLMAGFDVVNINAPHLEHIAKAAPLPRLWRGTIGYRFTTGSDLQWLPMLIMTRQSGINQANATLTAVYKNKFMLTAAYQNIDPTTGLGNISVYAGVDINKRVRIFASHGVNAEYQAAFGITEQFTHIGVKWQIL